MSQFTLGRAFVDLTADDARIQASFGRVMASMTRLQARFRSVAVAAAAMFAAGGGLFAASIKSASNFEYQMARVSTVLSQQTVGLLPDLASGVQKLAAEFGQSTKSLSDGLYDILSAGVPASRAMDVLREAAMSARAGFTETSVAAGVLVSVLNAYQIDASRVAEVSNKLFEAVRIGKLEFADFEHTLGRVAPLAAIAGVSIEQLLGAISTVTTGGATPEQATTQVLNFISAFAKGKKKAAEAAEELGVELDTSSLQGENLIETLKKLQGLSIEQLTKVFPDIRSAQGAAALTQLLPELERSIAAIGKSTTATGDAVARVTPTLKFQFDQFAQSVLNSARTVGTIFLPYVKKLVVSITSAVSTFQEFVRENQQFILTVIGAGAALATTTIAIYGTATALKILGGALAFVGRSPLVVLGVGLVALAGYLVATREEGDNLSETIDDLGGKIAGVAVPAISTFGELASFVTYAFETIKMAFASFATSGAIVFLKVAKYTVAFADALRHGLMVEGRAYLDFFFKNWRNIFIDLATGTMAVMTNLGENIRSFFTAIWDYIASGGATAFEFTWQPLLDGFKRTTEQMPAIADRQMTSTEKTIQAAIDSLNADLEREQNEALKRREKVDNEAQARKLKAIKDLQTARDAAKQEEEDRKKREDETGGPTAGADEGKAQFVGLQDLFKRIQESAATKTGPDETEKRTADAVEQTAVLLGETNKLNQQQIVHLARIAMIGGTV